MLTIDDLNERWGDITALPLDLPYIQPDDWNTFWDIWKRDRDYTVRNAERMNVGTSRPWLGIDLIDNSAANRAYIQPYSADMAAALNGMIKLIEDCFPFQSLSQIRLWQNVIEILPHRDLNVGNTTGHWTPVPGGNDAIVGNTTGPGRKQPRHVKLFPNAFRIMLMDNNPRPTFYLTAAPNGEDFAPGDNVEDIKKALRSAQRHYVRLPSGRNSFVFADAAAYHGADLLPGHSKILVVLKGRLDRERYDDLMVRSMHRYQDYAIKIPYLDYD